MPRNARTPDETFPRTAPSLSGTTGCRVISFISLSVATFARLVAHYLSHTVSQPLRVAHCHPGPPAVLGQSPAAAVITGTVRAVIANPGMQRFLDREGDLALRLLTTKASDFETRLIALIGQLVSEEASAGRLNAAVPMDHLPY